VSYAPPPGSPDHQPPGYVDYRTNQTPGAPTLPTGVKVLAILGIIFAIIGLLCRFGGGVMALLLPTFFDFEADGGYLAVLGVLAGVQIVASLLLLFGSIAALRKKELGRKALLTYAGLATLFSIVAPIIAVATLQQNTIFMENMFASEFFVEAMQGQAQPQQDADVAFVTAIITNIVSGALQLIFPIALLIYFTRPHVKALYQGDTDAGFAGYGNTYPPQTGGDYYGPAS
jgi:hypothetical protein